MKFEIHILALSWRTDYRDFYFAILWFNDRSLFSINITHEFIDLTWLYRFSKQFYFK